MVLRWIEQHKSLVKKELQKDICYKFSRITEALANLVTFSKFIG